MKRCYNCNAQFDDNTEICPKCGAINDIGSTVNVGNNNQYYSADYNQENPKRKNNPIIIAVIACATLIVIAVIVAIIIISTNKQKIEAETAHTLIFEEMPSSSSTTDTPSTVTQPASTQENVVYNYNYYYDSSGSPYGTPHNDFSFDYYSDYDYLFPSDQYLLTTAFLDTKTSDEIDLIRNEIYARHGYIFKVAKFRNYFEKKAWYHGTESSMEAVAQRFNSIEQKNIKILVKYQNL